MKDKPFLGLCKVVHGNFHGAVGHHIWPTHLSQTIKLVLNQVAPYVELSWHPSISPEGLVSIWFLSQAVLPLVLFLSNPKLPHLQNWGNVVGPVWKCCLCALASCLQGLSNACLPWMDFFMWESKFVYLTGWKRKFLNVYKLTPNVTQSSNPFLEHLCVPALRNREGRKRERKWGWLYPEHWCKTATLICKQF